MEAFHKLCLDWKVLDQIFGIRLWYTISILKFAYQLINELRKYFFGEKYWQVHSKVS